MSGLDLALGKSSPASTVLTDTCDSVFFANLYANSALGQIASVADHEPTPACMPDGDAASLVSSATCAEVGR